MKNLIDNKWKIYKINEKNWPPKFLQITKFKKSENIRLKIPKSNLLKKKNVDKSLKKTTIDCNHEM